ncbi:MAG: hypothetical protein KGM17_13585 [Sphingomonadales bacterium]|nr:hypothetical protein [Sphingomonadales bacterium]
MLAAAAPAPASPSPAPAQDQPAAASTPPPEHPITDQTVTAGDVATTPLSDLNLKKQGIPQVLIDAENAPYSLGGLNSCPRLAGAVRNLDAILGEDIDVQAARGAHPTPGSVAKSVVGAFIPFRGVIRELSGANAQEKKVQAAIYAGSARRAFLKGVGLSRGCRYPARPAVSTGR